MAGVRINAIQLIYSLGRRAWNQDLVGAVTDKDGAYTISLARAGDYFVVVSYQVPTDAPAGSADRLSPKTFYPGTTDGFAAPTVALRISATAVADIVEHTKRTPIIQSIEEGKFHFATTSSCSPQSRCPC
jgi:hypothetical protein